MSTILTVDHAYDGGSRIELIFTNRVTSADLVEIVAEIAQAFGAEILMVDARGADFHLPEAVEDQLNEIEFTPPVIAVTDAAIWGDRLYEAKDLLK